MSNDTSLRIVCRLLGGSGRPQLHAVPARRLPALCTPFGRQAVAVVPPLPLPLAA